MSIELPEPTERAHIAFCRGCERPSLSHDFSGRSAEHPERAAEMSCPRCGTTIRPEDIAEYELNEDDSE